MKVKKCPPFIDAMTYGFLMPLAAEIKVEKGEFSWDSAIPAVANLRSPSKKGVPLTWTLS
jgi:hypothetical protein